MLDPTAKACQWQTRTYLVSSLWTKKKKFYNVDYWSEKEDAEKLLALDDEDDELYGDFEDLETGEKHEADDEKKDSDGGYIFH